MSDLGWWIVSRIVWRLVAASWASITARWWAVWLSSPDVGSSKMRRPVRAKGHTCTSWSSYEVKTNQRDMKGKRMDVLPQTFSWQCNSRYLGSPGSVMSWRAMLTRRRSPPETPRISVPPTTVSCTAFKPSSWMTRSTCEHKWHNTRHDTSIQIQTIQ